MVQYVQALLCLARTQSGEGVVGNPKPSKFSKHYGIIELLRLTFDGQVPETSLMLCPDHGCLETKINEKWQFDCTIFFNRML